MKQKYMVQIPLISAGVRADLWHMCILVYLVGSEGLCSLVALLNQSSLTSLQAGDQQQQYEEEDMTAVFTALTQALGK